MSIHATPPAHPYRPPMPPGQRPSMDAINAPIPVHPGRPALDDHGSPVKTPAGMSRSEDLGASRQKA